MSVCFRVNPRIATKQIMKRLASMEDDWELVDMARETKAHESDKDKVAHQEVEDEAKEIQEIHSTVAPDAPFEPTIRPEAYPESPARRSPATTPKPSKGLSRLEKMFAVLLVWSVLSIVWQSFVLSRVEAYEESHTSTGQPHPPVAPTENNIPPVETLATPMAPGHAKLLEAEDGAPNQTSQSATRAKTPKTQPPPMPTSMPARAERITLRTTNTLQATNASTSLYSRSNHESKSDKVYVQSGPATRRVVARHTDSILTANVHPFAWEDPQLWAEVFAYTTDRSNRASQAKNWSGRVARLTEESFPAVVTNPTDCTLVLTFARWCGQVAEFLSNVDFGAVAEDLRAQGHSNVTVGAFESSKVHMSDRIAKLIPGGVHWLNLVLYPKQKSQAFAVRFGDWFGVRSRGARTVDIVEFVKAHCGRHEPVEDFYSTRLNDQLIPYSAASPATALEWSAASLLGSGMREKTQFPISSPCTLCVLGHSNSCTRCSSRVLVRYGTMLEEHISLAKYIKSHLGLQPLSSHA